jgi:hypothetical protein
MWLTLLTLAFLAMAGAADADTPPIGADVVETVDEAVEAVESAVEPVLEEAAETVDHAVATVEESAEPVIDEVTETLDHAVATVQESAEPVIEEVTDGADESGSAVPAGDGVADRVAETGGGGGGHPADVTDRSPSRVTRAHDPSFVRPAPEPLTAQRGESTVSARAGGASSADPSVPSNSPFAPSSPLAAVPAATGVGLVLLAVLAVGVVVGTPAAGRWALPPPAAPPIDSFALSVERPG